MNDQLLSRAEAAARIGISVWTLRRWEKEGKLHPVRLTALSVKIRESELETLIEQGAQRPAVMPKQLVRK